MAIRKRVTTPRKLAQQAWNKPGAGPHTDRKKQEELDACREYDFKRDEEVNPEEPEEEETQDE